MMELTQSSIDTLNTEITMTCSNTSTENCNWERMWSNCVEDRIENFDAVIFNLRASIPERFKEGRSTGGEFKENLRKTILIAEIDTILEDIGHEEKIRKEDQEIIKARIVRSLNRKKNSSLFEADRQEIKRRIGQLIALEKLKGLKDELQIEKFQL